MRKEFELTEEQLKDLKSAIYEGTGPFIYLSGGTPLFRSAQENANCAWDELGKTMGFVGSTVQGSSRGERFFTAEVSGPVEAQ